MYDRQEQKATSEALLGGQFWSGETFHFKINRFLFHLVTALRTCASLLQPSYQSYNETSREDCRQRWRMVSDMLDVLSPAMSRVC